MAGTDLKVTELDFADIKTNLIPDAVLAFADGFNIHFKIMIP